MKKARKIFESKVKAVVLWRDGMSNERIPGNRLAPSASQVHAKDAVDWFYEEEMKPAPSEHFNINNNDWFFQDEIAAAHTDD